MGVDNDNDDDNAAHNDNHDNNDVGDDADLNRWPVLVRTSPIASIVFDTPL